MGRALRILSANLWNGRADGEAFANIVTALAVDVVAVQELSPEQAEALSAALPHGEFEPDRTHTGMGIAMARPGEFFRVPMPCRDTRGVRLHARDWPCINGSIEILNVHIMAPHVLHHRPGPFVTRTAQVRALEEFIQGGSQAQLAAVGDFNSTPMWPAYRRIASHLSDAAVLAAERSGRSPSPTWGPWVSAPRLLRIDHGFVRGCEVEQFQVIDIPKSDHSAVVMDISSPAPEVADD